jgi:7-keto-8-aminopelargonate synthetase-like enzyme
MFSASPTPATVASVLSALSILRTEPQLRERLWSNIHYVHARLKSEGFDVLPDPPMSAILTIPIGTDSTVRAMSRDLYDAGVFVSSVAYPGVPLNEGRLRISLSAALTRDDLDRATAALVAAGAKHGILDRTGPGQPLPTVAPAQ